MSKLRRIDLFYHGYEEKALDRVFGRLQSNLHFAARTTYRKIKRKQLYTGFYTAFLNLKKGLEALGMDVHVNDFAHARHNPNHVIGISGFPGVYQRVKLPNPAVFGPGFVPRPADFDEVTAGHNIKIFTQPSEWYCTIWRPKLGKRITPMFVPIILDDWPNLKFKNKTHDVVIYDKIRWHREYMVPRILDRLKAYLDARGLSYTVLQYGNHRLSDFKIALHEGKSMAFLCEHETQGIAYQEAMASGIPVFAWDEGNLVDPEEKAIAPNNLQVSSVPYFESRCGLKFKESLMERKFDQFWSNLSSYEPRAYVAEMLSPERSARIYLDLLDRAAEQHAKDRVYA